MKYNSQITITQTDKGFGYNIIIETNAKKIKSTLKNKFNSNSSAFINAMEKLNALLITNNF